jgi:hypothetical protein
VHFERANGPDGGLLVHSLSSPIGIWGIEL